MKQLLLYIFSISILCFSCKNREVGNSIYANWSVYLGDNESNQYSPLAEITPENVKDLEEVWTYSTGDKERFRSWMECNPLMIDGILYGTSPKLKLFAVDAATGEEIWVFDPFAAEGYDGYGLGFNRGVSYWRDFKESRILFTAGSYLYAINARTGKLCTDFGDNGKVELHVGLEDWAKDFFVISNTPGIVYEDLLILGTRVSDNIGAAPGHVRAFDVKTGELEWIFHTIPKPGEAGYETWPKEAWKSAGGANCWGGFSLDEKRGMVFIPTGSASFDLYGGDRIGENLFANCILALDANTGKRIWHYQTVHHDLWDYDLPSPPNLVTLTIDSQKIDAVAQISKSGYVFILNRETGEPVFPIEEVPVHPSKLNGEEAWPTQPIPTLPPPFSRQSMELSDLTNRTPEANAEIKEFWSRSLKGQLFIPPSEEGTIVFPGLVGGAEWGGASTDPESGVMYVNSNELPYLIQMFKYEKTEGASQYTKGKNLYATACVSCHGKDLEGGAGFSAPGLIGISDRLDIEAVTKTVKFGKGSMPSYAFFGEEKIADIVHFLMNPEEETEKSENKEEATTNFTADAHPVSPTPSKTDWKYPYVSAGNNPFRDKEGFPAINPPWGTLNAIDLNEGKILWQKPLGHHPRLGKQAGTPSGTENYGGPVATAGGLVFIAATMDEKIRAFDQKTGAVLWEAPLPAAGYATPTVYGIDGKQYVVIACGGTKIGTKTGDEYVAFALPN